VAATKSYLLSLAIALSTSVGSRDYRKASPAQVFRPSLLLMALLHYIQEIHTGNYMQALYVQEMLHIKMLSQ
jgi:hypothetical protein